MPLQERLPIAIILAFLLARVSSIRGDVTVPESNVIAHASEETLWVANVLAAPEVKPSGEKTVFRYRALNTADQSWHELPTIAGRVVQMANRGQTAAVLTRSGDWLLVWPDGTSMGPGLPRNEKMIALASERDRNTLYAVGLPPAGTEASNLPAADIPATQRAVNFDKPVLFAFEGTGWKALANCPDTLTPGPGEISLAVVDRVPMLAQQSAGGKIRIFQLDEDHRWIDRGAVTPGDSALNFRLLSATQRPTLWIGEKSSGGLIYFGGEKWNDPIRLALSRPMAGVNGSLVSAAGALRLFLADDKGKLFEQRFDTAANRSGDLTALTSPQPVLPQGYDNWPMLITLTVVAFMMLSTARRRSAAGLGAGESNELVLATAGQRLMAGLIDGTPIILGIIYVSNHSKPLEDPADPMRFVPIAIALLIYLVHTTVSELIAGRTLGKILVGLHVLAVDGKPATPGAIVVRNLLRLIDVFPVPLAFLILTSPMKQRLGDLLAGTIVVIGPSVEPDEDGEES